MTSRVNFAKKIFSASFVLLALQIFFSSSVSAESAESAPSELKDAIQQIEEAANAKDLTKLMELLSPEFENSDGLNYESLSSGLKTFWERYPTLKYKTELQSWDKVDAQLVAETTTSIQGKEILNGRIINLDSQIRSRQYFKEQKLVRQEIVSEKTQVTSGDKAPAIKVSLPEVVKTGEEYNFDVILQEPLGNDVLLGAALEEKAVGTSYAQPGKFELDLLSAGGIFKVVKAPDTPDNRWLSAILIQSDGINVVTQRVRVEK